jgi:hypothetical protein
MVVALDFQLARLFQICFMASPETRNMGSRSLLAQRTKDWEVPGTENLTHSLGTLAELLSNLVKSAEAKEDTESVEVMGPLLAVDARHKARAAARVEVGVMVVVDILVKLWERRKGESDV